MFIVYNMWDWTLLSQDSLNEIKNKVWESMDNDEKEIWLNENLTEEEGDRYDTESRRALIGQDKMYQEGGVRRGKKKHKVTKKMRKRKMTRRTRSNGGRT
jgi:hypothetical protein